MIKHRINKVLSQAVTRRTFLAQMGLAALAIIGIPSVLKSLELKNNGGLSGSTYGGSTYGGRSSRPAQRKRYL